MYIDGLATIIAADALSHGANYKHRGRHGTEIIAIYFLACLLSRLGFPFPRDVAPDSGCTTSLLWMLLSTTDSLKKRATTFLFRLYFRNLWKKIKNILYAPSTVQYRSAYTSNQIPWNTWLLQALHRHVIDDHVIFRSRYITTMPWYVQLVIKGGSRPRIRHKFARETTYNSVFPKFTLASRRKRLVKFEILCKVAIKPRSD